MATHGKEQQVKKIILENSGSIETEAGTEIAAVDADGNVTSTVGDITAVVAGTGLSGGGTSGSVTLNVSGAAAATLAVTSGAIIRGSGAGVGEELAKGTANQIMQMDGGGGFPGWQSALKSPSNNGTPGTGVTALEIGDGYNHTTILTMTAQALDPPTAGAAEAHGHLLYTFPAGVHVHEVTYMDIALQGGGTVDTDTPDVGIGSVIGSGANATLNAVGATSEDYITGQTATNCSGTATVVGPVGAVAGVLTGISLNGAADVKAVYLNYADTWAGADTLAATGTVVLKWTTLV